MSDTCIVTMVHVPSRKMHWCGYSGVFRRCGCCYRLSHPFLQDLRRIILPSVVSISSAVSTECHKAFWGLEVKNENRSTWYIYHFYYSHCCPASILKLRYNLRLFLGLKRLSLEYINQQCRYREVRSNLYLKGTVMLKTGLNSFHISKQMCQS